MGNTDVNKHRSDITVPSADHSGCPHYPDLVRGDAPRSHPRPRISLAVPLTLLVLSAVLLLAGFVMGVNSVWFGPSQSTTGIITASPDFHPVIDYQVNGVPYHFTAGEHGLGWTLGEELTVLYNPRHPEQANTVLGRVISLIFVSLGLVLLSFTVAWGIFAALRHWRQRQAIAHGQLIQAEVTHVKRRLVHSGVGRETYSVSLTCRWTSPDGVEHLFRSTPVRLPPITIDPSPCGVTLPIWVDPAHPRRYYIDDRPLYHDLGVPPD